MVQKLTFIDMFAGIGGFRSGMEQAGHKCVGWIEFDKFDRNSYEAMYDQNWGGTPVLISERSKELISLIHKCGVSDFHAKTFRLAVNKPELKREPEVACSLKLSDYWKKELKTRKRYLPIYSWKTLKICYQLMADGDLQGCRLKWTKQGTIRNGQLSILPKSCLSTESVYTLSDILEEHVPDKYFLSRDKVEQLVKNNQSKS